MRLNVINSFCLILFSAITLQGCSQNTKTDSKYNYQSIDNGPFSVKTYTLKNGLKVFLVPRDDKPLIQTRIIVKAGSNQEPDDARGLAHYLEHLLFNGTSKIGAFNFEKEAPLLERIESLYEMHRKTSSKTDKLKIYKKIDSLSFEASKYSRQNEYSDLMIEMGITFLNAFTNSHITGYMNGIPSNQLEKWLTLESERFRNPVFRGFHTELETVFEEMNARSENGYQRALAKLQDITFSSDHYKSPIGTVEGLKNPSLTETKKFYNTYYVPNNMAIILVGDFNADEAIGLIEKNFSWMQPKELPKKKKLASPILQTTIKDSIVTPENPSLAMFFVQEAANTEEAVMAEFVEMLFLNGYLGIADIGQTKANTNWFNTRPETHYEEFTTHYFEGEPKDISLKELEEIVLNDIERLKTGNFPDWLLEAVANDLNKRFLSIATSNSGIMYILQEAYTTDIPLDDYFLKQEKFHGITKAQVMEFAKKYYKHYSIVYKKQGPNNFKKLSKPSITALSSQNNSKNSAFGKKIKSIESKPILPKLLDFDKDIKTFSINHGTTVNYVENKDNDLFNLRLIFDKPNEDNKELKIASNYLKLAGTNKFDANEFKEELYKIGTEYNLVTNDYGTTLYINGLSKNLEKSITLLKHLLLNLKVDKAVFETIVKAEISKIENQKSNKGQLFNRTLDYVSYGSQNYQKDILTKNDLENLNVEKIVEKVSNLFDYGFDIYFYGAKNKDEITSIFNKINLDKPSQTNIAKNHTKQRKVFLKNNVFLVNTEGKQIDIAFTTNLSKFNKKNDILYVLFNDYLSTMVNERIRETKGLAYSAFSKMAYPNYANELYGHYTKLGTQTDKFSEALKINHDLIENMPIEASVFSTVKSRRQAILDAQRIVNNAALYHYEKSLNRGLNYDYRKHYFEVLSDLTLDDFEEFYKTYIKNSIYNLIIIGDTSQIDKDELSNYGEIIELSKEELFGN
ncbi:M16 family metallopeptidase [Xanthomarina gelatinilytica]|uniref:M16 family metallopeptidase n=1 Tax=Xanthomarina gelatinilytica TaxID=1137281 RepID=UPI003AA85303